MFNKVLVPLDGSKLAEQVFPHVAALSRAFDPEIFLVGVCEPEETDSGQQCRLYIRNEAELLKDKLGAKAGKLREVTLEGHAAEKIIEYARAQGADVILASSHGRSGIKPWPLGSTVNRLLHERLPIIVIQAEKEASRNPDLFSRVLVPLDGSEASTSVITPLIQVSEKTATEITLVRIIEKEHHVHTLGGLNYIPYLDSDMDTKKAAAAEYLKGIASRFTGTRAVVKTEVHVGDPADEILKLASHKDASLIALASHVHSALESWFYGSVTQKIIQAAKRSFLLVPTEGTG